VVRIHGSGLTTAKPTKEPTVSKFIVYEVADGTKFDVVVRTPGGDVREVSSGSALVCADTIVRYCDKVDLLHLKAHSLPNALAFAERAEQAGFAPADPGPATDALLDPADRPLFAAATRAAEVNQPHAG
jgi:hypothetical protein